jgi:iron complex transport system ATP-binding protein
MQKKISRRAERAGRAVRLLTSAATDAAILDVSGLSIRRDGTVILRDIHWRARRGEHWVMLGANGSGKTSLLGALTGYLMPTAGEIAVFGERYGESDWRELRKRIGLVSSSLRQMMADSEPALDSVASGKYAMIDFWGTVGRADRAKAMKILRQIECEYLADRPWAYLSQGERQRVLIGRALMAEPRLLILDEPCAGLDPVARELFLQFVERLGRRRGAPTLVLVTHHVEEIMPVFSHALLLREGALLAAGKKNSVLTNENLSQAFGAKVTVARRDGRLALKVRTERRAIL